MSERISDKNLGYVQAAVDICQSQHRTVMTILVRDLEQMLIELRERRAADLTTKIDTALEPLEPPTKPLSRADAFAQPRWVAWAIEHDSHGASIDSLVFMPEGDKPDWGQTNWRRMPWLDEPEQQHVSRVLNQQPAK